MSQAQELFEKLASLKTSDQFLNYCIQILGAVERIHVDFKEKRDRRDSKLENDDKKNLAKAVSGFANSGGGVLIWGLEDETLKAKPITNIQQFMQNLLQLAPQVADPIVGNVDGNWLISNPDTGEGFGILFIPESMLPPHRVVLDIEGVKNHYFVRSGNSFILASHTMLEDMFGRRPKPNLKLSIRIHHGGTNQTIQIYTMIVGIENNGRGSAKFPYLALSVNKPYKISEYGIDGNGHFGLPRIAPARDVSEERYGSVDAFVIHPGMVCDITAIIIELDFAKLPYFPDVIIDYKVAADGVPLIEGQQKISIEELVSAK